MLHELHLRGLGVIKQASIELQPGLNVVTGETGVGKTLLVTSLALLSGARGNARLVDGDEAVVEAVVCAPPELRASLGDLLDEGDDDEIVLVRRLSADGRSRAWVAGQLVPLSVLSDIGERLVEIHGQGAGFALARPPTQLKAIDILARNDPCLDSYRASLLRLRDLEQELSTIATDEAARERELDLLRFQADEIDRAAVSPDEDDAIAAALTRLDHAERLSSIGAQVLSLSGADGAAGELSEAHKKLRDAASIDPGVGELVERLAEAATELVELARDIRSWTETLEADPRQLESLRERKALLDALKRKYGGTINDMIATATTARKRLAALEGVDERIGTLEGLIAGARAEVDAAADELTKRRRKAAKELTKRVSAELPALALPQASFEARCSPADLSLDGGDHVEFLFSSSRSRSAEPLGKIASGGELSRAMIAVTLALAASHQIPILVFDEADQGIGGEAALELGRRLWRLGRSHQVLVVSHLPQIAAYADRHIAVRRTCDEVTIDVLGDEARLAEVSRMLAGLERSDLARAHAAELLDLAMTERQAAPRAEGEG